VLNPRQSVEQIFLADSIIYRRWTTARPLPRRQDLHSGKRTDGSALIRVSQSLGSGASSKAAAAVVAASKVSTIMAAILRAAASSQERRMTCVAPFGGRPSSMAAATMERRERQWEVARRRGVPLASLDKALRGAGSVLGVPMLGEKVL
jgi:hypothetical protein